MANQPEFDVFLAHNTNDKSQVKIISDQLKRRGLKPWIDEEQIAVGQPFQKVIQQAIPNVKCAAVFIGSSDLGKWQEEEVPVLLAECKNTDKGVIPVFLPGCDETNLKDLFLRQRNWVCFVNGIKDAEAIDKLECGITGRTKEPFFDVYICYNKQDRDEVEQIAQQLKEKEIKPWLNEWEVPSGSSERRLLDDLIRRRRIWSVAVFIGSNGAPWQEELIEEYIYEFVSLHRTVIPVFLKSTLQEPDFPIYLKSRRRVDFRHNKPDPIKELLWSITGEKQ